MKNSKLKRKIAMVARWLHVYLSMASFTIIFFFAVTGLTLNHAEKFGDQLRSTQKKGKINVKWVNNPDKAEIARLEIVEYLRMTNCIKGKLSDLRIDDSQVEVSFRAPGYAADVFINRITGEYDLTISAAGFIEVINDLHKGRDTGTAGSFLIDASAILLTLVSLTGLVLLLFLKRKRLSGLITAAGGTIIAYIVYKIWIA